MQNIPNHVAIIMDGNGRWAKKRGLKRSMGHKKGSENLEKLCNHIFDLGIKYLSVYAFSTENFKRDKEEVDYLMNLFVNMFALKKKIFIKNKIKVIFSASYDNLRSDVIKSMHDLEKSTKDFQDHIFNICLNYGSRLEIIDMTKKVAKLCLDGKININDIDENIVSQNLYQNLPDIDFVIRTSGEQRISNFMLWQSSYAEYYFPETLFPDFNEQEFDKALLEYQKRDRRFGGTNENNISQN